MMREKKVFNLFLNKGEEVNFELKGQGTCMAPIGTLFSIRMMWQLFRDVGKDMWLFRILNLYNFLRNTRMILTCGMVSSPSLTWKKFLYLMSILSSLFQVLAYHACISATVWYWFIPIVEIKIRIPAP